MHIRLPTTLLVLFVLAAAASNAAERYAFLVGVKQYDPTQLNDLQFTEDDVTELSALLKQSGYTPANIVLMTQKVGAAQVRFAPTAKNIRKQLDLLLSEVKPSDTLLLAFSGHGVQFEGDEDSYFCPSDADLTDRSTLIPLAALYKELQQCPAGVKVLLVDACRNEPVSKIGKSRRVVDLETLERQRLPEPPGGVAALFSCSRGEQSFEHPDLKHGIFFNFIIKGLSGQADLDKDEEVSLAELEQFAVKEVQRYARVQLNTRQTPERRGNARGLLTLASVSRPAPSPLLQPRPGQPYENSIGLKLAWIPAGEFFMGSTAADLDKVARFDPSFRKEYVPEEQPRHKVGITRPFYLGLYDVTKAQFARFVQEQNYTTEAERDGQGGLGYNQAQGNFARGPQYTWRNAGFPQDDNHPVVNVTWNDAVAFCQWLSRKEQQAYRLPTEAEWEYACRAGSQTLFQHGDDPEGLALVGNVADGTGKATLSNLNAISAKDGYVFTSPAGRFKANAFGLYDMHGSVWQWCSDWFDSGYYQQSPPADPQGPATGLHRVYRGGSWRMAAWLCRSAYRGRNEPSYRDFNLGFRVALSAKQ